MSDQGRGRARGRGRGRGAPAGAAPGAPAPGVGVPAAPGGAWGGGAPAGLQAAPAPQQGAWGGAGAPAAAGPPAAGSRPASTAGGRGRGGRGAAPPGVSAPPGMSRPAEPASGSGGDGAGPRTTGHRGGSRTDVVRRGMGGDSLSQGLEEMSLHDRLDRRAQRQQLEYFDRPDQVQNRKGTHGQQVKLITNYVNLAMSNQWHMNQYSVAFNPEVDNVRVRRGMIYGLQLPFNQYDGGYIMYTLEELESGLVKTVQRKNSEEIINITFVKTGTVSWSNPCAMSIYNVTFKKIFGKYMQLLEEPRKRAYIDASMNSVVDRYNIEVQKGFMATVYACEQGLLLNTDLFSKVVRTQNVLNRMGEIHNRDSRNFKEVIEKELLGSIVMTRYNMKSYRVDDIAWDENPLSKFTKKDGTQETYVEYMQKQHEKATQDKKQPLLVSKSKRFQHGEEAQLIKLIPEHCYLTGLSDSMRTDFNLMKNLAVHTRVGPGPRAASLTKFIQSIHACKEGIDELAQWGIRMDTNLFELTGRVLPAEKITIGRGQSAQSRNADWGSGVRNNLLVPVTIDRWLVVFPKRSGAIAENVMQTLGRVMQPMNIRMQRAITCELPNDGIQTYLQAIDSQLGQSPQLVVCILPTNRKDRYDALKKRLTVQLGIPSQIIVERTVSKPQMLMSVCTKIGLQINVKLGGELWAVDIPLKTSMVVGYDTYHDSGDKVKGASQGALVCSLTPNFTRYWGSTVKHHGHQELCSHLYTQMKAGLSAYYDRNKTLPSIIFYYRDGVGDGQLRHVRDFELVQIKKAIKDKGTDYNPKLVFVVVKKRINTRFFTTQRDNPAPGTIVDSAICRAEYLDDAGYDFFLVSQSVRQGTATPTHYHVLVDDGGFGAEKAQRLTYKLCHLYYNWPGTIRTPAPCQYAHKLAYLAGQSLHASPKPELNDKLHYL